jgi:hypothetical protein
LIAEDWLREAARRGHEPHGVVTYDASAISDGTPWIHWRTARALEARGIARIDYHPGEGADIYLVPAAASGGGDADA